MGKNKKQIFIVDFIKSINKFDYYKQIANKKMSENIKYFFKLVAFYSIILTVCTIININNGIKEFKNLISRIKYEYSLNQSQIADSLGVKKTYLSDMINGRVPYNETMSKKISEIFPVVNNEQSSYNKTIKITESDINESSFSGTLVYDIDATCGMDNREIEFAEDRIIGSVNLPEISKTAKIVTANGDSMEPVIYNGNRVVIREIFNWEDIFYGQIYLILLDEYRMIKYIRRYEQDEKNYIILRSENSRYDDIKLHKSKIRKLFIVENILSVKTQI